MQKMTEKKTMKKTSILTLNILMPFLISLSVQAADVKPGRKEAVNSPQQYKKLADAPELKADAQSVLTLANKNIVNINTEALKALLEEKRNTIVIDVRNADELTSQGGYLRAQNIFNIPRGQLEFSIETLVPVKNTPIVVYDDYNQRSVLAAETLVKMGYTQVANYADGFYKWKQAGLPLKYTDLAVSSFLYSKPKEVIPGVWSAIGETGPGTYQNSGHNNNLSFIITEEGVVVMNSGDNYLLAQSLHEEIKKLTRLPVKYVVLENSQGHALLGSSYWQEQGAKIIVHKNAAQIFEKDGSQILQSMRNRAHDKAFKTELFTPDIIVGDKYELNLGSWKLEVLYLGLSHSPGDLVLWIPAKKLVISGDVAFYQRMPPLFEDTDTAAWLETWTKFEALGAEYVIPGHGVATNMVEVTKVTKGYLTFLRDKVAEVIKKGGSLIDAYEIDQSSFAYLDTYYELHKRNVGMIFRELEF
jgi:rhodanese-related sulfurtransferase/glyoxylase-like metal-dependent hydrolase (beta-lactamase superfamily II)